MYHWRHTWTQCRLCSHNHGHILFHMVIQVMPCHSHINIIIIRHRDMLHHHLLIPRFLLNNMMFLQSKRVLQPFTEFFKKVILVMIMMKMDNRKKMCQLVCPYHVHIHSLGQWRLSVLFVNVWVLGCYIVYEWLEITWCAEGELGCSSIPAISLENFVANIDDSMGVLDDDDDSKNGANGIMVMVWMNIKNYKGSVSYSKELQITLVMLACPPANVGYVTVGLI